MALGALLETLRVAATGHSLRTEAARALDMPDEKPTFDIRFVHDPALKPSALIPFNTPHGPAPIAEYPTIDGRSEIDAGGERRPRLSDCLVRDAPLALARSEAHVP